MQTGVVNRNRVLVTGLCMLIAGCGGAGQAPGGGADAASGEDGAVADGAPGRDGLEGLTPDSAEYERIKLLLVGARARGAHTRGSDLALDLGSDVSANLANAIVQDPGCLARTLAANDDGSTAQTSLPFSINFFGTTYNSLFINNNGNVTFNAAMATFTPFTINARTPPIIAPFFADVDTRGVGSSVVQYSAAPILFEGHPALCVNWVRVGYYNVHADKLNSFQLLLVGRADTGAGNFDIVMNHNQIVWETGDASGGSGGFGGTPAGAGFSAGNGDPAAFFQFPGSLSSGGLLDSNGVTGLSRTSHFSTVIGRHIFSVRNGQPITDERITLAPASGTIVVGVPYTITATLTNDRGDPLPNRAVTFRIVAGPNSGLPPTVVTTNASGQAAFTYPATSDTGQDQIQASFVKSNGQTAVSDPATTRWTDERITLAPLSATAEVGQPHTVTATLTDDQGQPLSNRTVTFRILSGPSSSLPPSVVVTNASGQAAFTYSSANDGGQDQIQASFVKSNGQTTTSGVATTTWIDERITLAPLSATAEVGQPHTVTATLTDDRGQPLANRAVTFRIIAGPDSSLPPSVVTTNAGGQAAFTYSSTGDTGQDQIQASFVKSSGQTATSGIATTTWTPAPRRPVAVCQDITLVADDSCGAMGSIDNGSSDPDGDLVGCIQSPGPVYGLGATLVTQTCTDQRGLSSSCTGVVTVQDATAPVITCPANQTAECVAGAATVDTGLATATDNCTSPLLSNPGPASYPLGTSQVMYSATDASGNSSTCNVQVTVVDTEPPQVIVKPTIQFGPANHSMHTFRLSDCASTSDTCAGVGDINTRGTITSIYSDEPEDAYGNGDGRTRGDITITGNSSFSLRAERQERGNGRVYGVNFVVADGNGNTTAATCHFAVLSESCGGHAVDDGARAGYTVAASSFAAVHE
jgi:protocatechuate 3,4-dioxygenase beta subunit